MIGEEILGLSKMNWNSFDLYTKLPATVETSRQIAKWHPPTTTYNLAYAVVLNLRR